MVIESHPRAQLFDELGISGRAQRLDNTICNHVVGTNMLEFELTHSQALNNPDGNAG